MKEENIIMIIKRLNKDDYVGKEFKVCYQTNGYYDIVPDKLGFKIQYVPFETCVSRSFTDEYFGEWLDNPIAYGAFEDEKLIGFVEGAIEQWNNRFRISNVCIFEQDTRNSGIGTALMQTILAEAIKTNARMVVLETQSCNENAIRFYRKMGFDIIGFDLYSYSNKDPQKHEIRIEMGMKLVKKESSIEDILDKTDTEAKNNQERLSHDEVFKAIRSSLKDITSNH